MHAPQSTPSPGTHAAILAAGALILAGTLALPAAEPEVTTQWPRLALFAAVIGNGNAVAMFNEQSTGRNVSLRVGDVYEGWRRDHRRRGADTRPVVSR
jgi:hypothetical protein